ncbi:hypothetical protein H5410_063965 [Solanum commersonii]|uniref:Uncharacterized protein n=1 Tax=Solanum commersonii TaxID=4109 RepID=A0A9J5W0J8_SOLCO|nr:hypothetical protein H5410_063965 [Solanum commersonii]
MLIPQIPSLLLLREEVHDPWAFYLHAALLRQAFAHCGKFPTAPPVGAGPCLSPSVADHPLGPATIIALPFPAVVPSQGQGSTALLTRPRLETPFPVFPVRLACVKHAPAFIRARIELSMRFIVALLIASLFVDKADSELSFIPRHNLYPCASYSPEFAPEI